MTVITGKGGIYCCRFETVAFLRCSFFMNPRGDDMLDRVSWVRGLSEGKRHSCPFYYYH